MSRLLLPTLSALALSAPLAASPPTPVMAPPAPPAAPWQPLEPGLDLLRLEGPPGGIGDGVISVVRIDPARFELRLLNASAPGEGATHSAREWARRTGAAAVVNAAMYQEDLRTSVSLMRARGHVNQRRVSKDRAVLAFDPLSAELPAVRVIDRDCDDLEAVGPRYGTLVQSIRLVSCERKNVWAPSDRRTSAAVVGVDGAGRVLFVHARTGWPIAILAEALLAAPIDLRRAMYVEGGPEAQLFVAAAGRELELVGAFEAMPRVTPNGEGWPVPNVLAAFRRPPPPAPSPAPPPRRPGEATRPAMSLHLDHLLSPAPLVAIVILAAACIRLARALADTRRRISELTLVDTLTGLGNRRLLEIEASRELARARRAGRWLFLGMADVDRLEPYNAVSGRPAGHALLAAIGSILRSSLRRAGDHSFRVGGDRFAFVFSGEKRDEGAAMADRIRERIAALGLPHAGNPPHGVATVSVGLVAVEPDGDASLVLLETRAQEAIEAARSQGRNCTVALGATPAPDSRPPTTTD